MYKDSLFLEESDFFINSSELAKKEEISNNISITQITLNTEDAKKIGRSKGKYITITYNKDGVIKEIETLIETIVKSFKNSLEYLGINKPKNVLFVGLGNKSLSCDKLGFLTIEKIVVTSNTHKIYKEAEGLTNIESVDFIKSMVHLLEPDLVIVFDCLKAENLERLGCTIQIATSGLKPGSAKTKKAIEISKRTIKCPVINIGIPTIINMKNINEENPNLLITTDDIDEIIENSSSILSIAINRLF